MFRPRGASPPQSSPATQCLPVKPCCTTPELRQHALMAMAQGSEITRRRTWPPNEPPAAPASPCTCLPSLQQLKAQARRAAAHALTRHTEELEARKGRRPGTLQPPTTTHWTPLSNNPGQMAHFLQRVRLGYCTREELQEDFEGQGVRPLRDAHPSPLVHYLLSCPTTAPLRPGPAPAAQPADGGC
ncbi:hypothetical protein GWK47_051183 [Chionoecetes opilio]|uniref:Uncharacterized protein n=1 Tax=Chionoecetes opilio TaxID=41210 RepID=A0A8J4Y288_CHIOP|nr:hypothetical protein GWK47_051183 [Chionoecetes opilio]